MASSETCTFVEEVIKEERFQILFLLVCGCDIFQEDTLRNDEKG
jgi:hypothetical protein